jgi:hypothetical protein
MFTAPLDEFADQGNKRMSRQQNLICKPSHIEAIRPCLRGDARSGCSRDLADLGLGLSKRPFYIKPTLKSCSTIELRSHLCRAEKVRKQLVIQRRAHGFALLGKARSANFGEGSSTATSQNSPFLSIETMFRNASAWRLYRNHNQDPPGPLLADFVAESSCESTPTVIPSR